MHRETAEQLPAAPLTAARVRRLLRWPQIRVAALAGVSPALVRIFELDEHAVVDAQKRNALCVTYARMRDELLRPSRT